MSYNLLLDTAFKNNNWTFVNCSYNNGYLESTAKVFGVKQELILPNPTKLYFRVNYRTENISVFNAKIGIQNNNILNVDNKAVKFNKHQNISVIDIAKQEKITLHIIFESNTAINKVFIEKPVLIDLCYLNKATWLKSILDKTIRFRSGYIYTNLYDDFELKPNIADFKSLEYLEDAKIGSIIKVNNQITIDITAKFNSKRYYLAKLDFKEINQLGEIYFNYNFKISESCDSEQIYILFKGNDTKKLQLILKGNDILPYMVNLKHLMIIDITNMNLLKADIPYLPFIRN